MAAIENIWLQTYPNANPATLDLSEQELLSCTSGDQCAGYWPYMFFTRWAKGRASGQAEGSLLVFEGLAWGGLAGKGRAERESVCTIEPAATGLASTCISGRAGLFGPLMVWGGAAQACWGRGCLAKPVWQKASALA